MSILLLMFACGPKAPVESWEAIAAPGAVVEVPELSELPLGAVSPRGEEVAAQAFAAGEVLVGRMGSQGTPVSAREAREMSEHTLSLLEEALLEFKRASFDPGFTVAAAARTGDAWRLALAAVDRHQAPAGLTPDQEQAFADQLASTRAPLEQQARAAYTRVAADVTADPRWRAHARWGLAQLEQENP